MDDRHDGTALCRGSDRALARGGGRGSPPRPGAGCDLRAIAGYPSGVGSIHLEGLPDVPPHPHHDRGRRRCDPGRRRRVATRLSCPTAERRGIRIGHPDADRTPTRACAGRCRRDHPPGAATAARRLDGRPERRWHQGRLHDIGFQFRVLRRMRASASPNHRRDRRSRQIPLPGRERACGRDREPRLVPGRHVVGVRGS